MGSLETLADRPNDNVRDDLLDFYKKHYSSDQMTLVILGKESIQELKRLAKHYFSAIPKRKQEVVDNPIPLFDRSLPVEVISKPVQDTRQMSMVFSLPSLKPYYGEKPLSYLGFLLGHEGEGSVLSVLKQQGWAEALSAGGSEAGAGNATFAINISLTESGLQQRALIRSLVFHALDVVRERGIEEWRYKEEQRLAKIAFEYREKGRPINVVSQLADQLHTLPPEEVISGAYLYKKFDEKLIRSLLDKMRPDNVYISTVFPEADFSDAKTAKVTQHYNVPYRIDVLSKELLTLPKHLKQAYQLPKANVFVPETSELYKEDRALAHRVPDKTILNEQSTVWVKQDTEFNVPKASISIRVKSPLTASSLTDSAMTQLLTAMVQDRLNENSYPALIAGLSYSLIPNNRGLDIYLKGYDSKMSVLLNMVTAEVLEPRLSKDRFDNVKIELLRQLSNSKQQTPYRQLMKQLPVALLTPYWSDEDIASALEQVTFEELKVFSKNWLKGSEIKSLIYGNIHQGSVRQWKESIAALSLVPRQAVAPSKIIQLPVVGAEASAIPEVAITVDHGDKAVGLYVQGVSDTVEDQAYMVLLRQVLESGFYSQLRTEQQLGYIVFLTNMTMKNVPASLFVVQSPNTSVDEIKKAILLFIQESSKNIPSDLSIYQQSAETKLLEKPQNLSAQAGRYWENIVKDDDSFSYRTQLVDYIYKITPEQLLAYYQKTLLNPQRSVWFTAEKDNEVVVLPKKTDQKYYQYP